MNTKTQTTVTKAMQAYARRITGGRQSVSGESIMVEGAYVAVKASQYSYSSHPSTCVIVPLSECNGSTNGLVVFDCDAVTLAAFDHVMDNLDGLELSKPTNARFPGASKIAASARKARGNDTLFTGQVRDGWVYVTDSYRAIRQGVPAHWAHVDRVLVDLPASMLSDLQVGQLRDGDLPMLRQDILIAVSRKAGVLVMYACETGRSLPNLEQIMTRAEIAKNGGTTKVVLHRAADQPPSAKTRHKNKMICVDIGKASGVFDLGYFQDMLGAFPESTVRWKGGFSPATFHNQHGQIVGLLMPIRYET